MVDLNRGNTNTEVLMINWGLLILRIVLGLTIASYGAQKLLGWFGGGGMKGTTGMMEHMGLRPPRFWALLAALSEFGGGVLLFLGFLSPLGSLGIIASMSVAIINVHWAKGFWNSKGGFEFPLINLTAALALALTGPGIYSLDSILNIHFPEPLAVIVGLVLVILGVLVERFSISHTPETASK